MTIKPFRLDLLGRIPYPLAINLVKPQQLVHFAFFRPQPHGAHGRGGRIGQPGVAVPDDLVSRKYEQLHYMKQLVVPAFTVFGEPRHDCAFRAARAPDNRSRQRPGLRRQSHNTDRHRSTERLPAGRVQKIGLDPSLALERDYSTAIIRSCRRSRDCSISWRLRSAPRSESLFFGQYSDHLPTAGTSSMRSH